MLQPVQLYRRWRAAAGWSFGMEVPSAPFSELGIITRLLPSQVEEPLDDALAEIIAVGLARSDAGKEVREGRAAFVIDLPGYLSAGVGAYLQTEGIAPVLLMAACYQPGAFLDGEKTLPNLVFYGQNLGAYSGESGYAFLLERERLPWPEPHKFAVLEKFDNRYALGTVHFPTFEIMFSKGIQTLVDVRPGGQEVAPDMLDFYAEASEAGFSIYRSQLDLEKLVVA